MTHMLDARGLDLVAGIWTDAPAWPEHGGVRAEAALGAPVTGVHGLLDHVETILGSSAPAVPAVVRIAAWQARLEAVSAEPRFWDASLIADGWATARLLLGWRDRLVDAGWDPRAPYAQRRLRDLAAAELAAAEPAGDAQSDGDLPPGLEDRIARAAAAIERHGITGLRRIRLIDARRHFPPGTRRLLAALQAAGVTVEQLDAEPAADEDGALVRLQRWLREGGEPAGGRDERDGSLVVASAASTLLAAEVLGQALAALADERVVLIAQGGASQALDAALPLAAQPRSGLSPASPYRGALQLLPLAFQTAWAPLDVQALLDLVLASPGPLAGRAQQRLASALERTPSVQSESWAEAWAAIEEGELERAASPAERRKATARVARWRAWAGPVGADPDAGMSVTDAVAICDRVAQWALVRQRLSADALYGATARVASDARRAFLRLGRERLPRPLVERVIDQALHTGESDTSALTEAAERVTLAHPGALWGPADTVVWWDFRDTGERAERAPWTTAERAELATHGATVDPDTRTAAALTAAWERAALHARRRLILVDTHGAHEGGSEHPFAHRIAAAVTATAARVALQEALGGGELALGSLRLPREPVTVHPAPAARSTWPTPAGYAERAADRRESATSLEHLVECPLKWALRHVASLRGGRARAIPDVHRLSGTLAHALAAEVFPPGTPLTPAEAEHVAAGLLDDAVDAHAMPLRQPEHAADLTRVRRNLPQAMGALARTLVDNHLTVLGSEHEVTLSLPHGPEVHGFVDLLTHDPAGAPVVLDLKWTRAGHHREDLAQGRAVQLATYVAALHGAAPGLEPLPAGPAREPRAGYFRLLQQEFATLQADGLEGSRIEGPSLADTWAASLDAYRTWTRRAAEGQLLAAGVPGAEEVWPDDPAPLRDANCRYCAFNGLCRIEEASP